VGELSNLLRESLETDRASQLRAEAEAIEEQYAPNAAQQFATGVAEGVAGPLLPLIQSADPQFVNEQRAKSREEHGVARALGNVVGYAGGALGGVGLPGMLVGLGKSASAKTAAALGGGALAKGAGTAAGASLEGLGMALSESSGDAIIDRAAGVPGASIDLADAAGAGLGVGAATGVISMLLPRAANALFKKSFSKRIALTKTEVEKRVEANKLYNSLVKDLETIEKAYKTPEALNEARRLAELEGRQHMYSKLLGDIGAPQDYATPVANRLGGRITTKTYAGGHGEIAKAKAAMKKHDAQIGKIVTSSLDELGESARSTIIDGVSDVAVLAAGGPKAWAFSKIFSRSLGAAQAMVYKGIMHLPPVRWAMGNALVTGKASGALKKMAIRDGAIVPVDTSIDMYVDAGRAFTRALKIPPVRMLTNDEVSDISDEIVTADPAKYAQAVHLAMAAKGVPPQAASAHVAETIRSLQYLQSVMPPVHPVSWVVRERKPVVTETARSAFSKSLRAAVVPASVLADFLAGQLTPEAARAWWATQPEWAEMMAEHLRNMIDVADAVGKKFTAKEKYQLGLMINKDGTKLGRIREASLVQYLQGKYKNEEQSTPPAQVGGPRPPGDPGAAGQNNKSPSQGLSDRLNRR
jgi:hypothetical protein